MESIIFALILGILLGSSITMIGFSFVWRRLLKEKSLLISINNYLIEMVKEERKISWFSEE